MACPLEIFLVATNTVLGDATDIYWLEARDATEYPTVHRAVLYENKLSGPKINGAKVEKPCSRPSNMWKPAMLLWEAL